MKTRNTVAIFIWNGGSYTVAPFGSKEPFFGTNPISFGIPTDSDPILCDMSTSEVPFMNLMRALKSKSDLNVVAGLNEDGNFTKVATEIFDIANDGPVRLLPMGLGYKGAAIMLLLEVLTGGLIGAKMGREATDTKFIPEEFGGWLLACDFRRFTNAEEFCRRTGGLASQIRRSSPASGVGRILLPGDRAHARYHAAIASGVMHLEDATERKLRKLAKSE
jgi:LDH2 family malate/lactate/ureidoglycolate dehydrogenase